MRGRAAQHVLRSVRYTPDDVATIAERLYETKLDVYIGTLEELAKHHGYALDSEIVLSDEIDQALYDEAQLAASQIVSTYNTDVARFVAGLPNDTTPEDALKAIEAWQNDRAEAKAKVIAVDQSYDAHADATLHFYDRAGAEPTFDFGGHGDPEPECDLCEAIKARNPHPLDRVLEIGSPHPQCAQEWHALIDGAELPDSIDLGTGTQMGLVGQASLLQRIGNRKRAVKAVAGMA